MISPHPCGKDDDEITAILESRNFQENQKRLRDSNVPDRYLCATFASYVPRSAEEEANRDAVQRYASKPEGFLVLLGSAGVGKTHLSCAVLQNRTGIYIDIPTLEILCECSRDFSASENKLQVLDRYARAPLLILDEIGRASSPAAEKAILYYIANKRYSYLRPTILVSNFDDKEFADYLGTAIIDRIAEKRTRLVFTGTSYRRKIPEAV